MGRPPAHPFLTAAESYLADVRPYIADLTHRERRRKLRQIAGVFEDLSARGLVGSTDPARFSELEIGAFVAWMRERNLGLEYQVKLLQYLRGLLRHVNNVVLERMKARKIVRLPQPAEKALFVKSDAWFEDTMRRLDALDGWRSEAVRFALAVYYHTGLRVKELRLARFADLDRDAWTLTVSHPKGEGAWASAGERVKIFAPLRPHVLDYLDARSRRLRDLGLPEDAEPLILNGFGGCYSEAGWRAMRLKVFREAGIERTPYRILRPTFAQRLKDRGAPIEAVSRALRHSSTSTTERFYARIRTERAWDELERLWEAPEVRLERKTA